MGYPNIFFQRFLFSQKNYYFCNGIMNTLTVYCYKYMCNMKSYFWIFIICTLFCLSCGSRQEAIEDLRVLVEDIRTNGNEYTAEQWADAEGIFEEVCDELEQYEYTQDEKTEISRLKGEYMLAIGRWKVQDKMDVVRDVIEQVSGAVKGLTGEKEN